jgi:ABC-type Fe3+ transport system permease subunit
MSSAAGQTSIVRPPASGFRRVWRTLRQLFHELVGAVFGVLALVWFQNSFRAWTRDVPRWVVAVALAIAALMVIFAWTSFRRSRRLE